MPDNAADFSVTIAALRRDLAEARAERDEALAQQTATAEVLGVINSSPGDLAPVFDAILEKAMRLCNASFGFLLTYDAGEFRFAAGRGIPTELATSLGSLKFQPRGADTHTQILRGAPFVQTPDLKDDEPYRAGYAGRIAIVDIGGARTALVVPLRTHSTVLGTITIYRKEVRRFADEQIALLQNFAAQAVIAMENARLITETREALEQQTATAEILQVINSSPGDLAPVFDAILEKAHSLCGAELGSLVTYDGEHFCAVATHAYPEEYAALVQQPFGGEAGSSYGQLIEGARYIHLPDLAAVTPPGLDNPIRRAALDVAGIRTVLLAPLRKDTVLLGYISAQRREARPFSEKEIALIENFAAQAVIAMENARLITETREALEQQTATAEVLQVINSSPGDLAPVFDAILEKALRLCDASLGQLVTSGDGEVFTVVAAKGPPAIVEFLRNRPPTRPGPGTSMSRLVGGELCVHIDDAMAEEAYRLGDPTRRAVVDLGGCRTMVSVGLRKDDALLGAITVYRSEVKPFSEKEIALIENFAAQAVIAIENARLLGELRARTDEIVGWNRELEARVAAQLAEIERTGKLRRFLAPQLADLIVAQGDDRILESHRREIVVVFCDLRGFTGFAERAEPEEVMALLGDYHAAMGPIVASFEGTLDHYAGDGIMVFFNDPVPTPDPARRAIDMAVAMRAAAQDLLRSWRRHGHDIGFGVGISQGYATLGQIGFAERMDYTAIGTVTNLAARLCAEAKDGQILVSRRIAIAVEDSATLDEIGDLSLKGLSQAVAVYNVP